jgi:hypothetical protein
MKEFVLSLECAPLGGNRQRSAAKNRLTAEFTERETGKRQGKIYQAALITKLLFRPHVY